jgi:hypothetical protein
LQRQGTIEPVQAFAEIAAPFPERRQRAGDALRELRVACLNAPRERDAQIRLIALEGVEPLLLASAAQLRRRMFREIGEEQRVSAVYEVGIPALRQLLGGILTHGFEKSITRSALSSGIGQHQGFIDQMRE